MPRTVLSGRARSPALKPKPKPTSARVLAMERVQPSSCRVVSKPPMACPGLCAPAVWTTARSPRRQRQGLRCHVRYAGSARWPMRPTALRSHLHRYLHRRRVPWPPGPCQPMSRHECAPPRTVRCTTSIRSQAAVPARVRPPAKGRPASRGSSICDGSKASIRRAVVLSPAHRSGSQALSRGRAPRRKLAAFRCSRDSTGPNPDSMFHTSRKPQPSEDSSPRAPCTARLSSVAVHAASDHGYKSTRH